MQLLHFVVCGGKLPMKDNCLCFRRAVSVSAEASSTCKSCHGQNRGKAKNANFVKTGEIYKFCGNRGKLINFEEIWVICIIGFRGHPFMTSTKKSGFFPPWST